MLKPSIVYVLLSTHHTYSRNGITAGFASYARNASYHTPQLGVRNNGTHLAVCEGEASLRIVEFSLSISPGKLVYPLAMSVESVVYSATLRARPLPQTSVVNRKMTEIAKQGAPYGKGMRSKKAKRADTRQGSRALVAMTPLGP